MKLLVTSVLLATIAAGATLILATERTNAPSDGSFVLAQRFCPNKRC
jgi:hypothetical protein